MRAGFMVFCMAITLMCVLPVQADYEAGRRAWDAGKPAEALREWRAAADAGERRAMLALGRLYVQGLGVTQDYVEAHKWFSLAAARGEMAAVKQRDALALRMTPEQVASAQERARTWRPGGGAGRTAVTRPRPNKPRAPAPPPRALREAQGLLAALGYEPGPADGVWRPASAEAYKRFLRAAGIRVSDTLTPAGLRALRKMSRGRVSGKNAALRAAAAGDISALKAALAAGADPNARGGRGWTPLMHAANKGFTLLIGPLLEAGAKPNLRAADGATALFIAALRGHSEIIAALMKAGADPAIKGPKGKTAEGLVTARIISEKNYGGPGGLHKALRANEGAAVIGALLERGADLNAEYTITEGETRYFYKPLHTAARYNKHPEVIALLLKRGLSPNEKLASRYKQQARESRYGSTPWSLAARSNENPEVVMSLVERAGGLKVLHVQGGYTPLQLAVGNKNPAVARLLLDRGADVNGPKGGQTPLHLVASNKNPGAAKELVELLIARGADLDVRLKDLYVKTWGIFYGYQTPLVKAALYGNRAAVSGFPPYERGRYVMWDGRRRYLSRDAAKKLKENKGAGADAGWFEGRADCLETGTERYCAEPLCLLMFAYTSRFALASRKELRFPGLPDIIELLLERGKKEFLDPRNHSKENRQAGSRCMFRVIHKAAINGRKANERKVIENWMRRNKVDLGILKQEQGGSGSSSVGPQESDDEED